MTRIGLLGILLALLASTVAAEPTQAPETPELVVQIGPEAALETNGYVQGQIVVQIQLISRYPFDALDLALPQIPDAEIIELMRPRTRKLTGYTGQGYVFEKAFALTPQRSGVLTVPSIAAVGYVTTEDDVEVHFDLASDPVPIKISGIAREFQDRWWLVSDRVEIDEEWSTPPEEIRVGEPVQRKVHLRVWGVAAEQLPELEHGLARGIRVSLADTRIKTEKSAEGQIADATYTWDLVADPQQVAFVKPIALDYWDPVQHRLRRAVLPALRLEPLPEDSEKIADLLMQEAISDRKWTKTLAIILAGVLAVPLLLVLAAFVITRIPTAADRRLRAEASDGSPEDTYRALTRWLARSGLKSDQFDEASTGRMALSNRLFARGHPALSQPGAIVSEALRFSRRDRARRLIDGLRSLW